MEQVIPYLPKSALPDLAKCLGWNPLVGTWRGSAPHPLGPMSGTERRCLQSLSADEQAEWLDINRHLVCDEVLRAGRSRWGNFWDTSSRIPYRQSAVVVAEALGIPISTLESAEQIEAKIVGELSRKILATMTSEQKEEWLAKVREEAEKYGINLRLEATGLGTIGLAQLSGFGVYMAASTVLGAINGALGLGLGFGVFVGIAKLIAFWIGPFGAAIFVLPGLWKMVHADPEKLLPIVAYIAVYRNHPPVRMAQACAGDHLDRAFMLVEEMNDPRGANTFAEMLAAQSDIRRNSAFYAVSIVFAALRGEPTEDLVDKLFSKATHPGQHESLARRIISQVSRLSPESLDDTLVALCDNDSKLMQLCYLEAPEGGEAEHKCAIAIAVELAHLVGGQGE